MLARILALLLLIVTLSPASLIDLARYPCCAMGETMPCCPNRAPSEEPTAQAPMRPG